MSSSHYYIDREFYFSRKGWKLHSVFNPRGIMESKYPHLLLLLEEDGIKGGKFSTYIPLTVKAFGSPL